ncbi:MAG: hypothetical protein GC181_08050 [Bacteroidetes bacterium]|nr:hypothetical protein [Bacteroidota bacterium]
MIFISLLANGQNNFSTKEILKRFGKIESAEQVKEWVNICENQVSYSHFAIDIGIPKFQKITRSCMEYSKEHNLSREFIYLSIYRFTTPDDSASDWQLQQLKELTRLLYNETARTSKQFVHVVLDLRDLYGTTEQYNELVQLAPFLRKYWTDTIDKNTLEYLILADLTTMYFRLKNYNQAIKVHKKQKKYITDPGSLNESSRLNNIGMCFYKMREYDSAMYYFKNAISICENIIKKSDRENDRKDVVSFLYVIRSNVADIQVMRGNFKTAQAAHEAQLRFSDKEQYPYLALSSYLSLAELYHEKGELNTSLNYLDSLDFLHRKTPYNRYYLTGLELRRNIYLQQGLRNKAKETMYQKSHLEDSIAFERSRKGYLISAVRFETEQAQQELLMAQTNLDKEKTVSNYQKIGLVFASVSVLGFVYGFIALRRKNRLMAIQQKELHVALNEREWLLKEVHHRVKNNLNIVIAILHHQSNKIKTTSAQLAFRNSRSFIISMSKIHELLYQQVNFSQVEMDQYLESIIQEFRNSYRDLTVQIPLNKGGVVLAVEQAQALSILICELIINSMKYAFPENTGTINIGITRENESTVQLNYQDSGKGFDSQNSAAKNSLGKKLMRMTAEQLKGELHIVTEGTFSLRLSFPNKSL